MIKHIRNRLVAGLLAIPRPPAGLKGMKNTGRGRRGRKEGERRRKDRGLQFALLLLRDRRSGLSGWWRIQSTDITLLVTHVK